jgi:hypothetical protein
MRILELHDNDILTIEYGFKNFDHCDPNISERIVATSYTNVYTDGEVVSYESNKLESTKELEYKDYYDKIDVNAVKRDKISIKNHSFVITELLVDEWVGNWLTPVQKQLCIFLREKGDYKSLIKACSIMKKIEKNRNTNKCASLFGEKNTYLGTEDEKVLKSNSRVHVLAKRK